MLVSLENKHLKRQLDTAKEHIKDLNDNINLYITLYQSVMLDQTGLTDDGRST